MNGARWLAQALVAEGVETLFGYPGGTIMPFYDALHGAPGLKHVLVRHEQGAGHAAEGYAVTAGVDRGFVSFMVVYDDGSFQARMDAEYGSDVVVVTADRELRRRVEAAGSSTAGPSLVLSR